LRGEIFPPGAIGFDWVAVGRGGVWWVISRPREKVIKKLIAEKQLQMAA